MTRAQTNVGVGLCVAVTLLASANCSHTTPYRRDRVATPAAPPAGGQVRYRILLIGDAGEPQPVEPVLDSLERWTRTAPERTLVVFLGDNAYPEGVTQENTPRQACTQTSGNHFAPQDIE